MITNQDRSRWFGASDTAVIMGHWDTYTFREWWAVKCGYDAQRYKSWAMDVGNLMEGPLILAAERVFGKIRQGKRPVYRRHRLRVNYDGLQMNRVIEVKTASKTMEAVPRNYWMQCQVLMYALRRRRCLLLAYLLQEYDYDNPYFPEIDLARLRAHWVEYDREWICEKYLPRLRYLARCLRAGIWPREGDFLNENAL